MIRVLLVDDHAVVRMGFRLLLQSRRTCRSSARPNPAKWPASSMSSSLPDVVVHGSRDAGHGRTRGAAAYSRAPRARARADAVRARRSDARAPRAAGRRARFSIEAQRPRSVARSGDDRGGGPALPRRRRSRRSSRWRRSTAAPSRRSSGCRSASSRCSFGSRRSATVQRIADDLKLSASTVGTHLYNIKQKLGVVNQSELTLIAIRHGLIQA